MFIPTDFKALRTALALGALVFPGVCFAQTIAITEYLNNSNDEATEGEWVELYNYGNATVNVSGLKLKDDDSGGVTLGSATIAPKDFLIVARDKTAFEANWLKGVPSSKVITFTGTFAHADSGDDEVVLTTSGGTVLWRVAWPDAEVNHPVTGNFITDHSGASTFYAGTDFTNVSMSTKAQPINRQGNDPLTGNIGYEGQEYTADPYVYSGGGDVGSPLRGNYPGANNGPAQPTSFSVDASSQGTFLNPGVRGLAGADQSLARHDNSDQTANIAQLPYLRGSSLRGVSGGLNADIYNWETRNAQPRPTTLEFLRFARDYDAELFITANIRGLTEPDPDVENWRRYYTSDTLTLANLAADWVRYCNRIVQTYREGDPITDARDAAVLDSLTWNSSYVNEFGTADNFTTLTAVGEGPIRKVKYWEIGNEPLISLRNAYSVTNAFTFNGAAGNSTHADYVNRYLALTNAMLAEDPTIKVGPCLVNARTGANEDILDLLLQSNAQVDFISYHPYGSMGDYQFPEGFGSGVRPAAASFQEGYLTGVYSEQQQFLADIKAVVAARRPGQVNTMEYAATETNVSDFRTNNSHQEGCMAHALGTAESIFSWGRLGLSAAHYWIWVLANATVNDPNGVFPVSMVYAKMRDAMGDRLIGSFDANDKIRCYVVGSSTTSTLTVWAMNFSNSTPQNFTLNLNNIPANATSTVYMERLQAINGTTTLASVNLGSQIPGGPVKQVDWTAPTVMEGADPSSMNLTLPAATLTLLTINNEPPAAAHDWQLYE